MALSITFSNLLKSAFIVLIFSFSSFLFPQNAPPVLSDITAKIDTNSHTIVVNFKLDDVENDSVIVSALISVDSGQTYLLKPQNVSGDYGFPVISGLNKKFSWNYDTSFYKYQNSSGAIRIKLIADDRVELNLSDIVNKVDSNRMRADMNIIEGIRHYSSGLPHLNNVKSYITAKFNEHKLNVIKQQFLYSNYTAENIIGRKYGVKNEDSVIILDGHFDTVPNSPGADDNGSAVVGFLEALRVLADYYFENSIYFIGFDLEEYGMLGSYRYVNYGIKNYEKLIGVLNFEMIGYYTEKPNSQLVPNGFNQLFPQAYDSIAAHNFAGDFVLNVGNQNSDKLKEAFDAAARQFVPGLRVISLSTPQNGAMTPDLRRSDHAPFWDKGYSALMLSDGANFRNTAYHTPGDTSGILSFTFMSNIVKASVATILKLCKVKHCGVETVQLEYLSDVNEEPENRRDFILHKAYPNPFNSQTKVSYFLPENSEVMLTFYNSLGEVVKLMERNIENAGNHSVSVDFSNLSSGVYFYTLQVCSEKTNEIRHFTEKLIHIK